MVKKLAYALPIQTAEPIDGAINDLRVQFEANLRVGQTVHLREAFNETNAVSGEKWYAPPGSRAVIDMVEPLPSGTRYWVKFPARYTVGGEEKARRKSHAFAPADLCPIPKGVKKAVEEEAKTA